VTVPADSAVDARSFGRVEVVRLPALVRGKLKTCPWPRVADIREAVAGPRDQVQGPTDDGAYLVVRRIVDRESLRPTDAIQVRVVPAFDPHELMEPDPPAAIRELMDMSADDVCAFVDGVGTIVAATSPGLGLAAPTSMLADRFLTATAAHVAGLFDGESVKRMLEAELGPFRTPALETWTPQTDHVSQGVAARMAANEERLRPTDHRHRPALLRAVPTTQLHITAGNSPVVPITSLLWAWASRGACVLKPAAEALPVVADIGSAVSQVDGSHPLVRHTTLAYWRGGEERMERVLLADGAFDRRLVWGSAATLRGVAGYGSATETLAMRARSAISLLAAADLATDLEGTARRAAADSVVADQQACMSSLMHVVVGTGDDADRYARALSEVMSRWDEVFPHRGTDSTLGGIVSMRRGVLATARWQANGEWPHVTSAVVRLDRPFDLASHPGGRLVVVRAVPELVGALPTVLSGDVSHVGVSPELISTELMDRLVSYGVDNVLPLGESERAYAGRPHDGMLVLSRLVRWVTG
jgi:Acyl-CoA reductase (LuxC)